MLPVVVH